MAGATVEVIQEDTDITGPLTEAEEDQLRQCEQVIKNGLNTFLAVGRALVEIRDNKLYRVTHKKFEVYCREVWDLGRARAYQKIDEYQVVSLLEEKMSTIVDISEIDPNQAESEMSPMGDKNQKEIILPINEAQARPLAKLSSENKIKAWEFVLEQVKDGKQLTSALVKKAVREVCGEIVKKRLTDTQVEIAKTHLVSNRIKNLCLALLEAVCEERNDGWKSSKEKEVIIRLEAIIKSAKGER